MERLKFYNIDDEYIKYLYEILKNGFTDQIWLLKQHLGEIKAYTGRGKMINSEFLNDLEDYDEINEKVYKYFEN